MIKIVTIVGARPQFIKASMLSRQFKFHSDINETILHTGQHFDRIMSDVFFSEMNIPKPKYNLNIHSLKHSAMTGRQMEGIEIILIDEKPDYVLVYGDTNSTLAGALAAAKLNIPIIHVEAGMRSYDKSPEEINRVLTDHISLQYYCTSEDAVRNLYKEGINNNVYNVGDIMYDAVLYFRNKSNYSDVLIKYNLNPKSYYLATIHRQENTDVKINLENIFYALNRTEVPIVIPIHPRTKSKIKEYNIKLKNNIIVTDPSSYLEILALEKNAIKIITDSGGVQKEAFYNEVPCITLRDKTEWNELVDIGANVLVGSNKDMIVEAINSDYSFSYSNIYGKGNAAEKIANQILKNH